LVLLFFFINLINSGTGTELIRYLSPIYLLVNKCRWISVFLNVETRSGMKGFFELKLAEIVNTMPKRG